MFVQLRKIVPTDNMIQETQKRNFLCFMRETLKFLLTEPLSQYFLVAWFLHSASSSINPSCHKRWQTVSNDPKQQKVKDKHPRYKEPPTYSVNTIQCTRFVELIKHAITFQSACMCNCLRIRDLGR